MLRGSTKIVCGAQAVVGVEVPGVYFTTQGVSPHRDVD